MQGTRKGKQISQDDYERIKELLKTRTPLELSQSGVCGYSTAYKIMSTTGYGDYRNKLREERERFYAKRKGISQPIPIKKNVPPMGTGSIRFNPPYKPLDGTGNAPKIFGSPFRDEVQRVPKPKPSNGPVIVVKASTQEPEAVIDVKSGSTPDYNPASNAIQLPPYDANAVRAYNATLSVSKDGIDSFKFVDTAKLDIHHGKRPKPFSKATIAGLCSIVRNGGIPSEMRQYLVSSGHGNKGLDRIARIMAYDEEGLEEFKKAWKQGEKIREERKELAVHKSLAKARQIRAENRKAVERQKVVDEIKKTDPKMEKVHLTSDEEPVKEESLKDLIKDEVRVIKIDEDEINKDVVVDRAYQANSGELFKHVKIKRKHMSYGTLFLLGAQATVLSLKLVGAIELSWWWVFLPVYILVASVFFDCFLLGVLTMVYFLDYVKENDGIKERKSK